MESTLHEAPTLELAGDALQVAGLRAHLVGIRGAGMRSLAELLDEAGWQVSGSDIAALGDFGPRFDVRQGHDAGAIDELLELVVYSDAVPRDNPELRRARQLGVETISYSQMLGRLMAARSGVAVAGTHGKSTTTAMTGEILIAAGLDPTLVVGAAPVGRFSGGRLGHGRWLVAEACEYRANFCQLQPELAAVLNVEPDHFDCYETQSALEAAFARFLQAVPASGVVVARTDCGATRRVVRELDCSIETFGFDDTATWQAANLSHRRGFYAFELRCRGRLVCRVNLPVPGRHNVLNAAAAAALASHCGASGADVRAGLEQFVALRRRLQLLGEVRDVVLVDDYAHHPTEVSAALVALREMYSDRRLVCVFEPHQASRLARLLDEFARSLQNADKVVVAEVVRAREEFALRPEVTADALAVRLAALGVDAVHVASRPAMLEHLKNLLLPGDVVVTMGAGEIGTVAHELGQGLRTFRKAS
jgi:UDP-N-acetylmuramate--alanine ligase